MRLAGHAWPGLIYEQTKWVGLYLHRQLHAIGALSGFCPTSGTATLAREDFYKNFYIEINQRKPRDPSTLQFALMFGYMTGWLVGWLIWLIGCELTPGGATCSKAGTMTQLSV